jgi:short subunit dehydrogenase-like uncharacterized protein
VILIYGVTGYTGQLVLDECLASGLRPLVAGRDAAAVQAVAGPLALAWRAASLDDAVALDAALAGVTVVIHCAGPFSRTSRRMADACLRNRVHYLDITGEIAVFEALAARDAEARAAGVMLLPGAGFDVVPSDCLAAHLKRRLPTATSLTLAFHGGTGLSRGTATTMAENAGSPGAVRRGGRIVPVPPAWRTHVIDFGDKPRLAATIPWGDVSTAFYSTGIPDIEVFAAMPPATVRSLRFSRFLAPILRTGWVRRRLVASIKRRPPGPSAQARSGAVARLWGEVHDAQGNSASARLECPDGYTLTAKTAVLAARAVLDGRAVPGFQTPSMAFGADFILQVPGCVRTDL